MSHDEDAARELELFIDSDADLYRQQTQPILKNLATKLAKGVYDGTQAIKLWMYLMDAGAKKYMDELKRSGQLVGTNWNVVFSVATRKEVANRFNQTFISEYALGNYNNMLPKKYQPKA